MKKEENIMYKGYQFNLFQASWGLNPGFKRLADGLNGLIPLQGKVSNPRSKNKNLETFRKAQNCIYDLFNNGLCNRRSEFVRLFDFSPPASRYWTDVNLDCIENRVEEIFTPIIIAAAKEQEIA